MFKPTTPFRQGVSRLRHSIAALLYGTGETTAHDTLRRATTRVWPKLNQLKLLPRTLSRLEWRVAWSLVLLCVVSGGTLLTRWYLNHSTLAPSVGGEYTEGIVGTPITTNPLLAQSSAELDLARLTTRGLFQHNSTGTLVPDLAQDWSVSTDQKTYLVTLKPSLQWSDGYPLTADDILFTFQKLQDKNFQSPLSKTFTGITIKRQGASTVSFTLRTPYGHFLEGLTLGLLPAHVWQAVDQNDWITSPTNLEPVGTGSWRFKTLTRDTAGNLKTYTLEPNPFTHSTKPFLTKIVLRFYPDLTSLVDALRQGLVDGVGGNGTSLTPAISSTKFVSYQLPLPQYTALFYNEHDPLLKVKTVRQALGYAINRTQIVQNTLQGQALPAFGPITHNQLKTSSPTLIFNPTKTDKLLTSAGFKRSSPTDIYQKDDTALEVTLTAVDQGEQLQVAKVIKHQWEVAGVKVNLNLIPRERLLSEVIIPRSFQVLLTRQLIGITADPYPFWHSSQIAPPGLNFTSFQNRESDRLLGEARQTSDPQVRRTNYQRFQEIISNEAPATFLYSSTYQYALSTEIKGFINETLSTPADRFNNLNQWYRATTRYRT